LIQSCSKEQRFTLACLYILEGSPQELSDNFSHGTERWRWLRVDFFLSVLPSFV